MKQNRQTPTGQTPQEAPHHLVPNPATAAEIVAEVPQHVRDLIRDGMISQGVFFEKAVGEIRKKGRAVVPSEIEAAYTQMRGNHEIPRTQEEPIQAAAPKREHRRKRERQADNVGVSAAPVEDSPQEQKTSTAVNS